MRLRTAFPVLAAIVAAIVTLIAGCGGGDDNKSSTPVTTTATNGPATVNASLGEYFIKLDKASVPKGQVRFDLSNDGKIKHEFVVLKTNIAPGKLPLKGGEADEEAADSPGEVPGIDPGEKKTLNLSLQPGKYVLLCNLPGHYKAGQYTGLSVK